MMTTLTESSQTKYWQYALWLAVFTVVYNLAEGLASIYFGAQDETLTLFGFGVDSFIEVMSGLGILAMVIRIRRDPEAPRSQFEQAALRVTGAAFYLLAAGLAATSIYNLFTGHKPTTTVPGLIVSVVSLAAMWALVLLAASLIYQFTGFGFVDSLGALGLIYFSTNEGKEAFEKARNIADDCDDD